MRGSAIALALVCLSAAVALGCHEDRGDDDGTGFRDGFISGYGKDCALHAPQIQARWRDVGYTRAYADGLAIGIKACNSERSIDATIERHQETVASIAAR